MSSTDPLLELEPLTQGQINTFAVIGRLMVEFARTEAYVHLLLCRRSGLGDVKARPIFSGMRLGDLAERLRGIIRIEEKEDGEYKDIDDCLTQLDQISKQRQKIAHRFTHVGDRSILTTNLYTSKSFHLHEEDGFMMDELEKMIADCRRIRRRILRHTDGEARRRERRDPTFLPQLFAPWLYRPPLPAKKPKSHSSNLQSQKRQPPASHD